MAFLLQGLVPLATTIGANAGTIASVAGTAASVGTSIAQAAKKPPEPPMSLEEKQARIAARIAGQGKRTMLTSGQGDLSVAPVGKKTLLGG